MRAAKSVDNLSAEACLQIFNLRNTTSVPAPQKTETDSTHLCPTFQLLFGEDPVRLTRTHRPRCLHNKVLSMSSSYNRIRVEDLLNDVPARGKISHRSTPVQADIFKYVCQIDQCGRRFQSANALLAHQKRMHSPPTQYVCPKCSSSFSSRANLTKHVS